MDQMFSGCSSLNSLDLSNFNTENVVIMDYMFCDCSSLSSLDISSFKTQNVLSISYMFRNCLSLITLDLSHFDIKNVTEMSFMFSECSSLMSVNLSSFNTGNVYSMNSMFAGCRSLISLDLTNFGFSNILNGYYVNDVYFDIVQIEEMFKRTGENSSSKPINIYFDSKWIDYIIKNPVHQMDPKYAKISLKDYNDYTIYQLESCPTLF